MKIPARFTRSLLYVVLITALLGLTGALGLVRVTVAWLALAQGLALALGALHAYLLWRFVTPPHQSRWVVGLGLTLLLTLAAALLIMVAYWRFFPATNYAFSACVVPFLIPYLFAWVYHAYRQIPAARYQQWFYPLNQAMPDLDLIDLSKVLVIQFTFPKKATDATATHFKAKAPTQMTLGELFLIFLNDYNEQNTTSAIQVLDAQSTPMGWLFYRKRGVFAARHYFDPALSFEQNHISDNLTITAERG